MTALELIVRGFISSLVYFSGMNITGTYKLYLQFLITLHVPLDMLPFAHIPLEIGPMSEHIASSE